MARRAFQIGFRAAAGALALLWCASTWAAHLGGKAGTLTVLTWSEYMDPELVADFEQEHSVKVRFTYFETDDHRTRILSEHDGAGFDVALVNGASLAPYSRRGWLAPLSAVSVPNRQHLEPRWDDAFPSAREYGVAYFWGTIGIAYRRDLYPEGFDSWLDLFRPADRLSGRIVMIGANRDVVGMALKALGYSANSQDREALGKVEAMLQAQKVFVRSYAYPVLSEQSVLVTGDAWASMIYSGDALALQAFDENIAYVVPDEGTNMWADYLTVLAGSSRQELAAHFIDFLNRPEIAARNAEYVYYATPNRGAQAHLPDDYFTNPVIYPDQTVLSRSEVFGPLAPRTHKRINAFMARIVD